MLKTTFNSDTREVARSKIKVSAQLTPTYRLLSTPRAIKLKLQAFGDRLWYYYSYQLVAYPCLP